MAARSVTAAVLLAAGAAAYGLAPMGGNPAPVPLTTASINVNGIFPAQAMTAESGPNRSECGHGAMMAWNDLLYVITYLSVPNAGAGTGLYSIDQNMNMQLLMPHNSTYANRMLHVPTQSIVIGPFVVALDGSIRTFEALMSVRIGGMSKHLTDPDKVYMLSMDGPFYEANVRTMEVTLLYDLVKELDIPITLGEQPHFKAAHAIAGKVWVASNTFEQADFLDIHHGGRLAYWSGNASDPWVIVERTAFVEITGRYNMGCTVFALGWDDASVILKVIDTGCAGDVSYNESVQTYRLPKAAHAYDHLWTTEWPRIREVESERFLMDMHGTFFELTPFTWGGAAWGIRPIVQHLRMIPDYASYRGFLVLGGNQVSSIFDNNLVTGQAQSGLWWGATDDLWRMGGKPQGWGGPWRYDAVAAGEASDAYLMTGYEHKTVHFRAEVAGTAPVTSVQISIEIDFTGSAGHRGRYFYNEPWNVYATVTVPVGGYAYHTFPEGFSAHWVRFVVDSNCNCTAQLTYT